MRVTFDPENEFPIECQIEYPQAGWQAILDHFARHVAARCPQPARSKENDDVPYSSSGRHAQGRVHPDL